MNIKITAIVLSALLIASCFVGCSADGVNNPAASSPVALETAESSSEVRDDSTPSVIPISSSLSNSDTNSAWSDSDTKIILNGSSASVSGSGAAVDGSVVTITTEGTYVVSGTLSDGQIVIAATNTDKVHLVLNGANITNEAGAPIYASQCDKLIVTLAEGTQNILTDGGSNFRYADTAEEEPNAALFCKDDLTINGTGSLTVNAGFNNGIGSKDDLLIVSGDIKINSVNHGLRGNDSVTIIDGNLSIKAGNDGIQTNNTKDSSLGWILIENGTIEITSGHDGIQADASVSISGGDFHITTGGVSPSDTTSDSYKGIKATTDITISGGSFTIDSDDDGIHANGNIIIEGGTFTIASGDDGMHADENLTINAGTIKVTEAYEGLEAANVVVTGGIIELVTSDDAINAAGGADQSGGGGRFGKDGFAAGGAYSVNISGGSINFMAGGDGIDSNGVLNISGGTIVAIINSTPDNGALDSDGITTFTGGDIIYGGTGTGSAPGGDSTQSYVFVNSGIAAGKEIAVKKDDQTLITFTPTTNFQYLALSSPDIKSGESYEVYIGGSLISTVTAGTGGGGMGGGAPGGMKTPGGKGAPDGMNPPDGTGTPGGRKQ